ncbi:MAG: efflux RND transporter periplasmic adaptor subunit [Actinobacteria bacterium]|nr:efflux RND transporter periplasmic adaptor subunit [Actinomycetota bacterium]
MVVLAALSACQQEAAAPPAAPIPEVAVITVTSQTVVDEPEFIGETESSRPVEIRPQVTGIIKERLFQEGRDVKMGDLLYQIDPVPFQAAAMSAKAMVAQAEARVVQAKQNQARVTPLLSEQAVSQKDVDDAVAEELAAKAALEDTKAQLVKAQFDLDNTRITAPIAGLIERTRVYEGRLVSAQTDLLTVIHQVDPMYVTVSVPEPFLLKRLRDRTLKRVQGAGVYELRGVITFVDGTVYPEAGRLDLLDVGLSTATGTRGVRVVFPNPERGVVPGQRALLPGQFVKVRFTGSVRTGVVLVPQRAVQVGPEGTAVYVVGEGEKPELRPVQATSWLNSQWLIEGGLSEGERVAVTGLQSIMPGSPVKTVPYVAADAAPLGKPAQAETGAVQ